VARRRLAVHDLAEGYLYSVHMAQHLLFTLVAPPC
jgi:cytochrome c oxidase assembly factor CtaG